MVSIKCQLSIEIDSRMPKRFTAIAGGGFELSTTKIQNFNLIYLRDYAVYAVKIIWDIHKLNHQTRGGLELLQKYKIMQLSTIYLLK